MVHTKIVQLDRMQKGVGENEHICMDRIGSHIVVFMGCNIGYVGQQGGKEEEGGRACIKCQNSCTREL
jgi:hypothetical protein